MGIKLRSSLQMIPWCLHLMGSHVPCVNLRPRSPRSPVGIIKLIRPDGHVKIYHRPILASKLTLEFPKHSVCRTDSFYIGDLIPALSEDDHLEVGYNYLLLPNHFFQTLVSFVTVASFASMQPSVFLTCSQPFHIQKTLCGRLQIQVTEEYITRLMMDNEDNNKPSSRVCSTPQLEKDYTQLVGSSRQWKPKLETIHEKKKRRKKLSSSFGIKTNKNNKKHTHASLNSKNRNKTASTTTK